VQDLIDEYQKEWKQVIYAERRVVDEEGFQYKYVPKETIVIENKKKGGASRKQSNVSESSGKTKFIYVKKAVVQKE
jgi:hypothetical protein